MTLHKSKKAPFQEMPKNSKALGVIIPVYMYLHMYGYWATRKAGIYQEDLSYSDVYISCYSFSRTRTLHTTVSNMNTTVCDKPGKGVAIEAMF